jgi:hypothetical protein
MRKLVHGIIDFRERPLPKYAERFKKLARAAVGACYHGVSRDDSWIELQPEGSQWVGASYGH